jgi:cytochrome oxidase Cu insertion factor (SCO1/SenC/PrrC family)
MRTPNIVKSIVTGLVAAALAGAVLFATAGFSRAAEGAKTPKQAAKADDASKAPVPPALAAGDIAPDFTLRDQNRQSVTLSDYRGKKSVVLAFYVFAFTGG